MCVSGLLLQRSVESDSISSSAIEGVFDVQRDHVTLLEACMALLEPDGLLIFSTNAQRFRLDPALSSRYRVTEVTKATVPPDFSRNTSIHSCFELR